MAVAAKAVKGRAEVVAQAGGGAVVGPGVVEDEVVMAAEKVGVAEKVALGCVEAALGG